MSGTFSFMAERCAIFIDGGYVSPSPKKAGKLTLDYHIFVEFIHEICRKGSGAGMQSSAFGPSDLRLLRTYVYDCPAFVSENPSIEEKQRQAARDAFFAKLKRLPRFELRLGRLAARPSKDGTYFEQKMVDTLLSIDLTRMAVSKQIDRAIIVAGDSDFVPAIQVAKDAGAVVHLIYFSSSIHHHLLDVCDELHLLKIDDLKSCSLDDSRKS